MTRHVGISENKSDTVGGSKANEIWHGENNGSYFMPKLREQISRGQARLTE